MPPALLSELLDADYPKPFALIHRQGTDTVDVLSGTVIDVDTLSDIPLYGTEVLALVPFHQVKERGFDAHVGDETLHCLIVERSESLPLDQVLRMLPRVRAQVSQMSPNIDDEHYARIVRQVIDEEIGRGEGANFVIRRDFLGTCQEHPVRAIASWMRELLMRESGAYWTFAIYTPEISAVGATPERHVSCIDSVVTMNPISGTFRHPSAEPTVQELLTFMADTKESEELVMVVDEELKMMCAACPDGGRMRGPYLKRMAHLTHTEYVLEGTSSLDPREVLRRTMFAPTVTGSPMGNACTVITRHETTPRGYYSGVLARFTPRAHGYDLDAPILIRTAYLSDTGTVRVPAGATLVRHSDPDYEVAETRAKAAGILAALGQSSAASTPDQESAPALLQNNWDDPRLDEALASRNDRLAPFWREPQHPTGVHRGRALIIDCGDDFTTMLAHQLTHLGFESTVTRWDQAPTHPDHDLVVFGPGPGDPRNENDPRIQRLRSLILARIDSVLPMIAVCLSHQVLADLAGLDVVPLSSVWQGKQREAVLFGEPAAVGYYNTFVAQGASGTRTPRFDLDIAGEADAVYSLQGPRICSVQGHLESVLSPDGVSTLERMVNLTTTMVSNPS